MSPRQKRSDLMRYLTAFILGAFLLLVVAWLTGAGSSDASGRVDRDSVAAPLPVQRRGDSLPLPGMKDVREEVLRMQLVDIPRAISERSPGGGMPNDEREDHRRSEGASTRKLIREFFAAPSRVDVRGLARNAEINPRRMSMSQECSDAIESCAAARLSSLVRIQTKLASLRSEELSAMARAGLMRPLEYTKDARVLADMDRIRKEDAALGIVGDTLFTSAVYYKDAAGLRWFVRVEGRNFGASDIDLPNYCEGMRLMAEGARDLYVQVMTIAAYAGALSDTEFLARLGDAEEWYRGVLAKFTGN